jgi:dethiobiotin synthetase
LQFQSILITGTDTGVGKTTVGCGVAAALGERGLAVGVLKPAETGCIARPDGGRHAADAAALRLFSASSVDVDTICPYALRDPVAPLVAAEREGVTIDVTRIAACYEHIALAHDITLVEGAGGLLVPLTRGVSFADLASALDLTVLVVVASRLGAINHALLTVRHARQLGLRVLGYIVNFTSATVDLAADTNVHVLSDLLGPPLGVVPYLGESDPRLGSREQLGQQFATLLRVDELLLRS